MKQIKHSLIRSIILVFLYFSLLQIVGQLSAERILQYGFTDSKYQATVLSNWAFIAFHFIFITASLIILAPRFKQSWQAYKQNFAKYLGMAILGMLGIIFINSIFVFETANQTTLISMLHSMTPLQKGIFIIIVTFIGPINEEVVFRQILIGELSKYLSKWLLLIISSCLFAILHIPSLNLLYQALPYFGSGLIIGFVYIKSKDNLFCSATIHWLNNILSLLL